MLTIVHEFTVQRQGFDISLKASFEIEEEIESAELDGQIFLSEDNIPWDGRLTKRERERIESEAYEAYADGEGDGGYHSLRDDSCVVDASFDDFDDGMAIKVAGRGSVSW